MALVSTLQKVAEVQREAVLANTKAKSVFYGHKQVSRNQLPAVNMVYTSGSPHSSVSKQCKDLIMHQVWAIHGRDPDEIAEIQEKLLFLWYKTDLRTDLEAVGFVGYELTSITPAVLVNQEDISGGLIGIVEFDVRVKLINPWS